MGDEPDADERGHGARCPPEDIGDPWGYRQFLDAVNNPDHEGHKDAHDWLDEDHYDPEFLEADKIEKSLAGFAQLN